MLGDRAVTGGHDTRNATRPRCIFPKDTRRSAAEPYFSEDRSIVRTCVFESQHYDGNFTKNGRIFDDALHQRPHFAVERGDYDSWARGRYVGSS